MRTHPAWGVAAVVLVLTNVVYFAWSRGALAAFGLVPERFTQSEPHRLANQVRPELLRVVKEAPPPSSTPEAAAAPPVAGVPAQTPATVPPEDPTPQPELNPPDRSAR